MIGIQHGGFRQFKNGNLAVTKQSSNGRYTFNSDDTANIFYVHPVKLEVGSRVNAFLNARSISGDKPRMAVEFMSDPNGDFASGGGVQGYDEVYQDDGSLVGLESGSIVPPDAQYMRVTIGYFRDAGNGVFEFSDLRIKTDAPAEQVLPQLIHPKTLDVYASANDMASKFAVEKQGAATAQIVGDYYELKSASDGGSALTFSANSNEWPTQEGAKFLEVKTTVKTISARAVVLFRYNNGISTSDVAAVFIPSDDFEKHVARFKVPDDAVRVDVKVGMVSFVAGGECHVKDIDVKCYGGNQATGDSFCNIIKQGGIFSIDNGVNRFSSNGISGISQSTDSVTLTFDGTRPSKPVVGLTMGQFPTGEDYEALVFSTTNTTVQIKFKDATTNEFVNISTLPDFLNLHVIAKANY